MVSESLIKSVYGFNRTLSLNDTCNKHLQATLPNPSWIGQFYIEYRPTLVPKIEKVKQLFFLFFFLGGGVENQFEDMKCPGHSMEESI